MTAIVGIRCQDGVVIAADSACTFVHGVSPTISQPTEKISIIGNSVIVACTGQVGMSQRFRKIVEEAYDKDKLFRSAGNPAVVGVQVAVQLCRKAVDDFASTRAQPDGLGALVAFPAAGKAHLCEFAIPGFQPELKEQVWYASMGSGQPITDPFLGFMRSVFWQNGPPTLEGGVFAAVWTLDHAIEVSPGGLAHPICIAVLRINENGHPEANLLSQAECDEHRQNVDEAKRYLAGFPDTLRASADTEAPPTPSP